MAVFFVLSTGRAGSRTLANVLSQSPDTICLHEPVPYLVEEAARYRCGEVSAESLAELLIETRPRQMNGKQYGESANRLSPALPVLASTFPDAKFVWLVRDGRDVVSSGHQRGWFDAEHVADTQWERHRLRADQMGELDESEWIEWSPFRRICWLWRRTNEMIESDLAALDPDRWRVVRLEDLEASMDDLAAFLDVSPVSWSVPRLNARSSNPDFGGSTVNRVTRVRSFADWGDDENAIFDTECGSMMDVLYPDWRQPATAVSEAPPAVSNADLAEIRTKLADLAVLRGELNRVVEQQARTANRLRQTSREVSQLEGTLKRANRDTEAQRRSAEELHQTIAELGKEVGGLERDLTTEAKARTTAERRLKQAKESTSYRLGHAVVRMVKKPVVLARSIATKPRRAIKRTLTKVVRRSARNPRIQVLAKRLPNRVRRRLIASSESLVSAPSAADRSTGGGGSSSSRGERKTAVARFGIRAAIGPGVDTAWSTVVDAHPVAELDADQLTHLDLVLASDAGIPAATKAIASELQSAVVNVGQRLAPLRPGLMPLAFGRDHGPDFLVVGSAVSGRQPDGLPPGRAATARDVSDLPDRSRRPDKFREQVQTYVGMLDRAEVHESGQERARLLVEVAACGLPVCVADPDTLHGLLPTEIIKEFGSAEPCALTNELEREQMSLRQRRVVHQHASPRAVLDRLLCDADRPGLRQPSISVTVASNRPEMIPIWAGQLAVQEYPDFEVVAAFHGDRFTDADVDLAHDLLGDRLTVCRIPASHTLGDALNTAADRAGGDLISKWDDDDLYDLEHLADLTRAMDYSGAALVGKAAEFAYLAGMGITVRRLKTSTERFSQTICGATLTVRRSDLVELGGWRRSRRRVDSLLIEDVRASGGATYRTSGFGFIMLRAGGDGHGHTWTADDSYFLRGAIDQRRGLDTAFAAVNAPASVVGRLES